jgi:hypothetical protein
MALATSNRAKVRYIKESTFGTIPGAGNPNDVRFTGESLAYSIKTDTSKEIRSDRQVTDLVQTGASASGGINFELSYGEFDTLLEAFLQGAWSTFGVNGVGVAIPTSATFAAGTLTAGAATSGASIFTNLRKGQWVKVTGSTIPGQNIYAQVSTTVSPTSTVLTFEGTPFTGLTGAGGAAVILQSLQLINGTTESSWTIERALNDVNQFFAYRGMSPDKLSLKFASGAITTGSLDFQGKDSVRAGATQLPGTPVVSKTYDVMNAVSGVGNVMEGGAALTGTFIKSMDLNVGNKLRARDAIGTLGAVSIGSGTLEVAGTIEVYLNDGTLYDKFINNTSSSIALRTSDGAGNGYIINLPKIKYGDAKVVAGGLDSDVMLSMPFTAIYDPVQGHTIAVNRVGVAPV